MYIKLFKKFEYLTLHWLFFKKNSYAVYGFDPDESSSFGKPKLVHLR